MRRFCKITDIELCTQKSDSKIHFIFSRDSKSTMSIIYIYVNIFAKHLWKIDFKNQFLETNIKILAKVYLLSYKQFQVYE